jgi:hypothetical protein
MSSTVTTSENSVNQPTRIPLPGDYPRKPGRYLEHLGKRLGWRLCNAEGETLRFLEDHENEWVSASYATRAEILAAEKRAEACEVRVLELEVEKTQRAAIMVKLAGAYQNCMDRNAELENVIQLEARRMRRLNRLMDHRHIIDTAKRAFWRTVWIATTLAAFMAGAGWAGKIPN